MTKAATKSIATKLKAERGTASGILTLWREDVRPSARATYELKLGSTVLVRARMEAAEAHTALVAVTRALETVAGEL